MKEGTKRQLARGEIKYSKERQTEEEQEENETQLRNLETLKKRDFI